MDKLAFRQKWLCVLKLGWEKAMLAVQKLGYPSKVKLI
jgi:hypothetical protein